MRTPAEIDAELALLYAERAQVGQQLQALTDRIVALQAERARLQGGDNSVNVQPVTKAQRRGRAIAKARADQSEDPRRTAITARWGSQAKAAKAAGISPGLLVGYLRGDYPVPKRIAKLFATEKALPADSRTWPKGIVD